MTNPTSGAVPRISATVKWYERAKGFGFLVRDNGSFDIFFREPVLTAVGLATLLPGAPAAPGPDVFGTVRPCPPPTSAAARGADAAARLRHGT